MNSSMKMVRRLIPVIIGFSLFSIVTAQPNKSRITAEELRDHIKYLSSEVLQGRMTGTTGDSLASEYIRKELEKSGFVPLSGDGLQRFTVTKSIAPGKNNMLIVNGKELALMTDYMPMPFSSESTIEGGIVFAGYGFNIKSDTLSWNDYSNIDVKGKWVLILRADPENENPRSSFLRVSNDRDKALVAKDMGAAGVLMVSGKKNDPKDAFEPLSTEGYSADIPVFRIKRVIADQLLEKTGNTVDSLESLLARTRKPFVFPLNGVVKGKAEIIKKTAATRNVVMMLPGEDPGLKNEYIVIGAHFDHLGLGGPGSGSRAVDTIGIHYGADDNASGVALMIELAEKFAFTKRSHKRSIICVAFSGEEEGLLGSKQYVDKPGIDLSKVNAMINLDMVGRLNESNSLQVSGVGTAEGLKDLVKSKSDTTLIKLILSDEGYGPSDHSSFYGKDIPVLFYFTGAHTDYHTPADTWDKINYNGMTDISGLIYSVATDLATTDKKLKFREAGPKTQSVSRMRGATLGIMPDFAGVVKNGLRADFVTPGRPGALGGMKKGDIIVSIEGKPVNNIQDYMFRMQQVKAGQTITVEVLRNNQRIGLLIKL